MKTSILSLLLILSSAAISQVSSNIISKEEFNNIEINDVKLKNIKATNADKKELDSLFTYDLLKSSSIDPDGEFYNYDFDGFSIGFSGIMGTLRNPIISSFEITNSKWVFTILGKSIRIGDNINILGDVNINNKIDKSKSVIYQYCDGCNSFIYIDFNKVNNEIAKIGFIEQT